MLPNDGTFFYPTMSAKEWWEVKWTHTPEIDSIYFFFNSIIQALRCTPVKMPSNCCFMLRLCSHTTSNWWKEHPHNHP